MGGLDSDLFVNCDLFDYSRIIRLTTLSGVGFFPRPLCITRTKLKLKIADLHGTSEQFLPFRKQMLCSLIRIMAFKLYRCLARARQSTLIYVEAVEYFKRGKIVIGIQFARQCDPVARGKHVREKLIQSAKCFADFPIVRGRVSPNILFFMISSSVSGSKRSPEALEAFAAKSPVLKGCRKIELIR